jgi:hypothetical protein
VNIVLGPKRALKVLRNQKRAWLYKGQPSTPLEGAGDLPAIVATSTSGLPSTEPTMTIEASSIELGTYTTNRPSSPSIVDFKSQLEAKEVVIARL